MPRSLQASLATGGDELVACQKGCEIIHTSVGDNLVAVCGALAVYLPGNPKGHLQTVVP